MKIVIDSNIPFIDGVFEPFGVKVLYNECIDRDCIKDADALIIRTRTLCDATLLRRRSPRIIATATIGFDHIQMDYCAARGIKVVTAAGCNARAVAQWVFAALMKMGVTEPQKLTMGIIGVGNVGSVVEQIARSVGFRVVRCDPPRGLHEPGFIPMDELLPQSDIVTIHTPLNATSQQMADDHFFDKLKPGAILLNSSRGEVVDQHALLNSRVNSFALDVWCNEPKIDINTLSCATIATPHIAGYSAQGKAMGTAMSVRSVARELGIKGLEMWYPRQVKPVNPMSRISWYEMCELMNHYYDITVDDRALRSNPEDFEKLRSNYNYRDEFF